MDKLAHLEAHMSSDGSVAGLANEDEERRDYRSEFDKSGFADYGAGI